MSNQPNHDYDDMINLTHHVSATHPQMSMHDRAAQFSPFAALTGYDTAIKEAARITSQRMELDENTKQMLDEKLQRIKSMERNDSILQVTFFVPDESKEGGRYVTVTDSVKKIDEYNHVMWLMNGEQIPINDIVEIIIE